MCPHWRQSLVPQSSFRPSCEQTGCGAEGLRESALPGPDPEAPPRPSRPQQANPRLPLPRGAACRTHRPDTLRNHTQPAKSRVLERSLAPGLRSLVPHFSRQLRNSHSIPIVESTLPYPPAAMTQHTAAASAQAKQLKGNELETQEGVIPSVRTIRGLSSQS